MSRSNKNSPGFSTKTALTKLRDDILTVLEEHKQKGSVRYGFIKNIISFSSDKVLLSGVAYSITLIYIICLILIYFVGETVQAGPYLLWEALFLFIILVINFLLAWNEDYLFRNEIPNKVKRVLKTLDEAIETAVWQENNYPHLCAPFSPCVILQWTYRDGEVVNLPWALLVEGDIVVLRPGQEAPGHCRGLQPQDPELFFGQVFQPQTQNKEAARRPRGPRVRAPYQNRVYRMCETPYLANLRTALRLAAARPRSVYERQRYLCTVKIMEGIVLPVGVCWAVAACVVRGAWPAGGAAHWTDHLLHTIAATLPLLQIFFPIAWVMLNCYGLARFKMLSEKRQKYVRPKSCSISEDANDPLMTALSESSLEPDCLKSLGRTFFNILRGKDDMMARTANIVHVLGSLSALCCVDKKGILSWPNPTAEKVFFLRNAAAASRASSDTSVQASASAPAPAPANVPAAAPADNPAPESSTVVEVLDLTHDQNLPFRVEFDEAGWRAHLPVLKPLGLAALLNTCAPQPTHTYAHFCAHLTCEALNSEDLVPVTNRRCLCELAKQIGFEDSAADAYTVEECLAVYRHLQAERIRRETRFARSLQLGQLGARVKVPLPHMLAVVLRDRAASLHMLTQGTADLVADCSVEYWDGRDLAPLTPADRKKILDFYQRNSLTAYCTAFAYKPLSGGISPAVSQLYLEVPAELRPPRAPAHCPPHPHHCAADATPLHFHSTDSLLLNEVTEEDVADADGFFEMQCNQVFIGMVTMQYQAQSDMVELIERLERACIRFVHFSKENELRSRVFSEKMGLESGWNCHISLMSEPASPPPHTAVCRAGSPRGGRGRSYTAPAPAHSPAYSPDDALGDTALLLAHSTNMTSSKALSSSAPGAINLDHSTVKFEAEVKTARHSITTGIKLQRGSVGTASTATQRRESADSALGGDGDGDGRGDGDGGDSPPDACRSLSCLTDSTDHEAPVNFDMSNRAKLPRGIENIRPHIEQVDNVPLLVSLFTDCTPHTVRQMIQIMQDYGEIVCVMGSAANCLNMEIFMQADASISVEPLYPVLCQRLPPYGAPAGGVGPIDMARALNSLPCSLSMTRDADVSLFALVTVSRHHMASVWNGAQFWMCAVCFLALLQVCAVSVALPPALTAGQALWGAGSVAAVSAALSVPPPQPALMTRAHQAPNINLHYKTLVFVSWCYACKFLPSLVSVLLLYGLTLRALCTHIADTTDGTDCWMVYPVPAQPGNATAATMGWNAGWAAGWAGPHYARYYLAQHAALALFTLHLIVISACFVHRHHSVWQKGFWTNRVWCATVLLVIIAQCIWSGSLVSAEWARGGGGGVWAAGGGGGGAWAALGCAYAAAPAVAAALNELIKRHEIKVDGRHQRRARLDFGTKLGMNSPF